MSVDASGQARAATAERQADAVQQRSRALRRAGIAVAAAVVLLVVALVVEQGGPEATAPQHQAEPRLVAPPAAEQAATASGSAAGGAVSAPPPASPADAAPPATGPEPASEGGTSPASAPGPAAPVADTADALPAGPPASAAPSQPDPASISGYRIQLGVFDVPSNAEALQREFAAQGLPAHVQSRVVLGPFPTRAKAQAAQAALRKAGQAPGILVPPRSR